MQPEAARDNLLYVSDSGADALYIYAYPSYKFVGYVPTGWTPIGECVDNDQNVWVAIYNYTLLEFAHGGTTPIATLGTPDLLARSCAVDPKTGDLAVAGYSRRNPGPDLEIYKQGKGRPKYIDTNDGAAGVTYDAHGNLYIDGSQEQANVSIGFLPRGSNTLQYLSTTTTVGTPGNIAWDGQALAVGNTQNTIYRFSVSASGASLLGTTTLDQTLGLGQFFIQRNRVIAPSTTEESPGTVDVYRYPEGGKRIRTLRNMSAPDGAVISLGAKGGSL